MPTIRFFGRILPEVLNLTINNHPKATWDEPGFGSAEFEIEILNSQLTFSCAMDCFPPNSIPALFVRGYGLASVAANLCAFKMGVGLTIWFDRFEDETGTIRNIALRGEALGALCTAYDLTNLQHMMKLVSDEPPLMMALRDLIDTKITPNQAPINCGRAVETLRTLFTEPEDKDRKAGWQRLNDNLRITQNYTRIISDNSIPPRHGDYVNLSGPVVVEIVRRSWTIMNRFLEFRKRNSQSLPEAEFPVLDS